MDDLIMRLEGAPVGSAELDSQIRLLLIAGELLKGKSGERVRREMGHWAPDEPDARVPAYTTSIDAALTLVPGEDKEVRSIKWQPCTVRATLGRIFCDATTAPLAIAAVALKARASLSVKEAPDG